MTRLFGTDGVRGTANHELTPELAFQLGRAGACVLGAGPGKPRVLIGRDTRISGEMLEGALIAGVTSAGADALVVGVVPTPAVAYLTKKLQCTAGVMISASHNPVEDNGIKFFGADGFKLSDEVEDEIEAYLKNDRGPRPIGGDLGQVFHESDAVDLYLDFLALRVPVDLTGMHIAVDCANGAASYYTPVILRRLGAQVTSINDKPNGVNINLNCGSTHPSEIQNLVREIGAQVGIAHDGDADRVIAVDEKGNLIDGDRILAICGLYMLSNGQLPHGKIAATAYSNGGLKRAFQDAGGDVVLTAAGDRYVLEAMLEQGLTLGGEQSGHVIFLTDSTTGDGILTSLKLLEVIQKKQKPLSELGQVMTTFPQQLTNVRVNSKVGWEQNPRISKVIAQAEQQLAPLGRLLVRGSGTEPVIRVMGEHPDKARVLSAVQLVADVIEAEQGGTGNGD